MTAPLLNLPILSPIAGPSTAPAAQGSAGGFEALLAGLFGEPAQQIAGDLFADKEMSDEDAALQPGLADSPTTPPQSAQAQVLAAMLVTAPQNLQTAADAATSDAPEGEPASASVPTPANPFLPPAPTVLTGSTGATSPQSDKTATAQTAQVPPQAGLAQPETQASLAPAATDPQVAVPAADQAPELSAAAKPTLDAGAPLAPTTRPATAAAAASTPPAVTTPPQALPPTPSTPVGAQAAPQVATQAETLATEAPLVAHPAQPTTAPRSAKPAETALRGATQGTATPVAHADDSVLPTAVAPVAAGSAPAGASPSIETETGGGPEAKLQVAADTPDFQAPAPLAAAHTTAPANHAAPVAATSETVANLTAQISKKLSGQSTKFDVELNPAGLGRVSVSVEIAASGKMTAAMSFDSPQAAAELRARSHDLQRALEQAGFDLSGGLSFDVAGDRSGGRSAPEQQQNDDAAWRGRAFQAVLAAGETVEAASSLALNYGRRSTTGVDVRI